MTAVFAIGLVTTALLLGLLTMISTLIGQRLPPILGAVEAGLSEARRQPAALHYAA